MTIHHSLELLMTPWSIGNPDIWISSFACSATEWKITFAQAWVIEIEQRSKGLAALGYFRHGSRRHRQLRWFTRVNDYWIHSSVYHGQYFLILSLKCSFSSLGSPDSNHMSIPNFVHKPTQLNNLSTFLVPFLLSYLVTVDQELPNDEYIVPKAKVVW
jgi:hypothetical protein